MVGRPLAEWGVCHVYWVLWSWPSTSRAEDGKQRVGGDWALALVYELNILYVGQHQQWYVEIET